MTKIYYVIAKRHKPSSQQDVILFYDFEKEESIKFMEKYRKKHGFTIDEKGKTYTIADIVLSERESTGKKLRDIPYHQIFDIFGKRKSLEI